MHQPVSDIYHLRLNTGEDLISEVIFAETKPGREPHVILVQPMKIICLPSGKTGYVTLSLMQWIFSKITSQQEFNVFNRDILTMSVPNSNLIDYYKETVVYFAAKNNLTKDTEAMEEYLNDLEKEIDAVEESDKVIEDGELSSDLENMISEFLNSISSNNKGTLH